MSKIPRTSKAQTNGRLVLFDGETKRLRSYDPTSNDVRELDHEKLDCRCFTAVALGRHIYVLCSDQTVIRMHYRIENAQWERMPDMIFKHGRYPPCVSFAGSLFVFGVAADHPPTNVVERIDPMVEKNWSQETDRQVAVNDVGLVTLGQSIYCIGGWDGDKETDAFASYTPSLSQWKELEPLRRCKHYCCAVAVNKQIFVIGGCDNSLDLEEVESYDILSGQWTTLSDMNMGHYDARAHYMDGWIYVVTREDTTDKMEKYDIANDKWHVIVPTGHVFQCLESVML